MAKKIKILQHKIFKLENFQLWTYPKLQYKIYKL